MSDIVQLSPHVANLIAAGEVVERPGSVVKELVENAIDAGAGTVTVEIQNGGLSYIRVSDDGSGIPAAQAETAFLRHATSKLRGEEDLAAIGTLGFRGEALAAIAAVSKVDLLTCSKDEEEGISLYLEGGQIIERSPAGCPVGTTIIVRELFYNTPARLKFMKKDSAEAGNVATVVTRLALSKPEVSFKLIKDGREELHTPGDGRLESAVYSVMGRDFAMSAISCSGSWDGISVKGMVSGPTASRGNRGWQHFFVNGRWVRSATMQAALEQAYKNRIMTGRYPSCVLHISMELTAVDVNVHPAKTEVKFLRDKDIFDAVYYAVMAALGGETARPELKITTGKNPDFYKQMSAKEYLRQESQGTASKPIPVITEQPTYQVKDIGGIGGKGPLPISFGSWNKPLQDEPEKAVPTMAEPVVSQPFTASPPLKEAYLPPTPESEEIAPASEAEQIPLSTQPEELYFRLIGETMRTYIIVETTDALLLIDKHAAHERMLFNEYKANASALMSQTLLAPVIFKPRGEEADALLSNTDLLRSFGYEISDFGGGSIVIHDVPADIDGDDCENCLLEMAAAIMEGRRLEPEALRDELLHTLACKAAIKAGYISGEKELEAIARRVLTDPEVRYCPHGRPVAIELTRSSLEKQFKRK